MSGMGDSRSFQSRRTGGRGSSIEPAFDDYEQPGKAEPGESACPNLAVKS
jgi:hypothetical protein